ncbi:hypothetical protein J6TS7_26400 [Paenibacillus dendritiformis]|nr:hypothetical protein J6TS7_26400 [Paenibacillus dendritiformis]
MQLHPWLCPNIDSAPYNNKGLSHTQSQGKTGNSQGKTGNREYRYLKDGGGPSGGRERRQ